MWFHETCVILILRVRYVEFPFDIRVKKFWIIQRLAHRPCRNRKTDGWKMLWAAGWTSVPLSRSECGVSLRNALHRIKRSYHQCEFVVVAMQSWFFRWDNSPAIDTVGELVCLLRTKMTNWHLDGNPFVTPDQTSPPTRWSNACHSNLGRSMERQLNQCFLVVPFDIRVKKFLDNSKSSASIFLLVCFFEENLRRRSTELFFWILWRNGMKKDVQIQLCQKEIDEFVIIRNLYCTRVPFLTLYLSQQKFKKFESMIKIQNWWSLLKCILLMYWRYAVSARFSNIYLFSGDMDVTYIKFQYYIILHVRHISCEVYALIREVSIDFCFTNNTTTWTSNLRN